MFIATTIQANASPVRGGMFIDRTGPKRRSPVGAASSLPNAPMANRVPMPPLWGLPAHCCGVCYKHAAPPGLAQARRSVMFIATTNQTNASPVRGGMFMEITIPSNRQPRSGDMSGICPGNGRSRFQVAPMGLARHFDGCGYQYAAPTGLALSEIGIYKHFIPTGLET